MLPRLAPLVLLLAAPAAAQVRLVETGIVCPRIVTGEMRPAPDTEFGEIRQIDQPVIFDLDARTVPTMTNLGFGFRIGLEAGQPARDVTIVVTHPPMGPRAVTRQSWSDRLEPGEDSVDLFTFEEDYEKVPGRWTFSVEIDGSVVVEAPFDVVAEGGHGPVEDACFQFMS